MLEVKSLVVEAGSFILSDVTFNVPESSCHIILGPTGSGKTLLLETVMGFRKSKKGGIFLDGLEITDLPAEKRHISYVPQDLAIFPHLTVEENIHYGIRSRREREKRSTVAKELIEAAGIGHLLERYPGRLSGGERQRVALVRALARESGLLALDEPFSSLHEALRKELWLLLKRFQEKYRFPVFMVTHDLEEAFFLGNYITIMMDGKIQQSGTKKEVYNCPHAVEVASFLGVKNLFRGKIFSVAGDSAKARCDELKMELAVPLSVPVEADEERVFGIRSEEVKIMTGKCLERRTENLLSGEVREVFEKGSIRVILFRPHGTEKDVEIELSNHVFRKLRLCRGKGITVSLKKESIFMINNG